MRKMKALSARVKSLFLHVLCSAELLIAFSLNFSFLPSRMMEATSALPATQRSEPITMSSLLQAVTRLCWRPPCTNLTTPAGNLAFNLTRKTETT